MSGFKKNNLDFDNLYITITEFQKRYLGKVLFLFGYNGVGQLGDNTTINKSSPIQTFLGKNDWKQVSCGDFNTSVIKSDNSLWSFGYNGTGQLGDNTVVDKSSPVQNVNSGTDWKSVNCGANHTAAIKTDGTLWLWGFNSAGQLGTYTVTGNQSSPIQTAVSGTDWKQVSCGDAHTAAIKTDNSLWVWGFNALGQLGTFSITGDQSSPIQTAVSGTDWKQVSCNGFNSAAIKTDDTLWVWGLNSSGQLGDNTTINQSSPIQTAVSGTDWKEISCGKNHMAAIKTDGTLWVWGLNDLGQLGTFSITGNQSSPIQTAVSGTDWKQVSCGGNHTIAIKTDGTLWVWGDNSLGQLGDNSTQSKSIPTQIFISLRNLNQVSSGLYHTAIISE